MPKRYYSLYQSEDKADIYIYGDITSWEWDESDVSSYTLSKELHQIGDVEEINVYINSYGGEVAEGLAIYNALRRNKATVNTFCDGFACSIASVIFMAGDNRYIRDTSLLMIHNAWTYASGNAEDLKKRAEDLEKINSTSINAYMKHVNISEEELQEMLDNETWIKSEEAVEKGFATDVLEDDDSNPIASQSIRKEIKNHLLRKDNKPSQNVNKEKDLEKEIQKLINKELEKVKSEVKKELITENKTKSKEDLEPKDENKLTSFFKAFFDEENTKED